MSDSHLFVMLKPHGWDKTEEAKDAIHTVLFEKETIPESPLVVPVFTANDPERGFGISYPKASELKQFGVPHEVLHERGLHNLTQELRPRPEWLVVKPVTSYKILTLFSKTPFVSEYILDQEIMQKAEELLKSNSIVVGIPRRETMFACDIKDMQNPDLVPNFNEFIKEQFKQAKPQAGPPITPIVMNFKNGKPVGYVKEQGVYVKGQEEEPEPQVQEIPD